MDGGKDVPTISKDVNHNNNITSSTINFISDARSHPRVSFANPEPEHFLFTCMKMSTLDKISIFLAELLGTALLVFLGCMGCVSGLGNEASHMQITLNFGLTVMLIIQIFGCISGAHLNPAVTVAALIYKMLTLPMAIAYVVAQVLGAFIGYGLLKAVTPSRVFDETDNICVTAPHQDVSDLQAVAVEFIATTVLILICCGVWDPRNSKNTDSTPLRFGLAITGLAIATGPYSGGSFNPARSFGPAVWTNKWDSHWVYWVGPLAAAVITSFAFKAVFWREAPTPRNRVEEFPLSNDKA